MANPQEGPEVRQPGPTPKEGTAGTSGGEGQSQWKCCGQAFKSREEFDRHRANMHPELKQQQQGAKVEQATPPAGEAPYSPEPVKGIEETPEKRS